MEDNRDSWVLFQFRSKLKGWQLKEFISKLLLDFIMECDPGMGYSWAKHLVYCDWDREAGIGGFRINNEYFVHVKMYLFSDIPPHQYSEFARGILFRDHYCDLSVEKVYLLADTFERFLLERKINFTRKNGERT